MLFVFGFGKAAGTSKNGIAPTATGMDIVGDLATMKRFNRVLARTSGIEAGPMSRLALVALFGLIASVPSRQRATPAAPASRFQPFRFNAMSYDPCWPCKSTPKRFLHNRGRPICVTHNALLQTL